MPRRIIIHAGFHKTGTSTIQATLRENQKALKPNAKVWLADKLTEVISAARRYSILPDPISFVQATDEFARLMQRVPKMPKRTLIISSENMVGHMPMRHGIIDYDAATALLPSFCAKASEHFPQTEVILYLSTRNRAPWLRSLYCQFVQSSGTIMDFDTFQSMMKAGDTLDETIVQIVQKAPVPVHHTTLEACCDLPLGPATPLLALCNLPSDVLASLSPIERRNRHLGDATLQALLEINRTIEDPQVGKAAKAAILAEVQDR